MKSICELNNLLDDNIIDLDTYWDFKLKRVNELQEKRFNNSITTEELDELLDYFNEDEYEDDCIDETERVGLHQTQWGWM
jgi:hypothetical protein